MLSRNDKEAIAKSLKSYVDVQLNIPGVKEFKDTMLSRSMQQWYLEQTAVLVLLGGAK